MKKLGLLIVIAMLASTLLAVAAPGKLLRLEVINQTGDNVYIKLEGVRSGQFYYLTVPPMSFTKPVSYFTLVADRYSRTTWACGYQEKGILNMYSQVRLNFVPCNVVPTRWVWNIFDLNNVQHPNFGEPTMEKIWYYQGFSRTFWVKTGWIFSETGYLWIKFKGAVLPRTYSSASGPLGWIQYFNFRWRYR